MKKLLFRVFGILSILGAPLIMGGLAHAASVTWDGGGTDDNWSTAANWSSDTLPVNGDILVFDMSLPAIYNEPLFNDIVGLDVAGITLTGAGTYDTSFLVTGNDLIISGPITGTEVAGALTLDLNITLGADVSYTDSKLGVRFGNFMSTSKVFDVSTHSFTLSTTDQECYKLDFFASLKGSGNIVSSTGASKFVLNKPADSYSGDIIINGTGAAILEGAVLAGSTVTVNNSAVLVLTSTADSQFAFDVVMNSTADPSLQANPFSFACSNVPDTTTNTTLSGSLTLQQDVIFDGYNNLNVTGTYTAAGKTVSTKAGSPGSITTSAGTSSAPIQTITIEASDIDANAYLSVDFNQTIIVNGQRGSVSVNKGGVLKGTGTLGSIFVNVGGTLAPGMSPGCINSGDLNLSFGTYQVELADLTACTEYDQTKVTGTVVLGGTLQIVRYDNMVPRLNNSFTIISNDGTDAVSGTFAGLAQGATTVVDGITYSISYTGGDGNDVVLVVTAVDSALGAPNTGAHIIRSGILLPIFAILSAVAIIYMNFVATKKK